jgi:hypothetical protein
VELEINLDLGILELHRFGLTWCHFRDEIDGP